MQAPHLTESRKSLWFWPGVTLFATALFFFAWAVLISGQDWLGQAIWGTLAAVLALAFLAMTARDSHRALRSALGRVVPPTGLGDTTS